MQRRVFVRAVVSAMAAPKLLLGQAANPVPPPPAPVPWMTGLNAATPVPATEIEDVVAEADLRFFTSAQMATLSRLSDLMVPSLEDMPGALAAGTPAFLDFLISSSAADRKQMYKGGLDWLEGESKKQFSVSFAQLDATQADRILRPWMRTWMSDHPPTEPHADFVNIAHADIRTATVNSQAWSEASTDDAEDETGHAGLYWYPIEPDLTRERSTGVPATQGGVAGGGKAHPQSRKHKPGRAKD